MNNNGKALRNSCLLGAILIVGAVFFPGCSSQVTSLDERDFNDPLIRRAQSRVRQGDKAGAIVSLNRALERKPGLAQAHLELGLLYDDYQKDYVRAIYHYQRYLEQRPSAQKRGLIEDLIRKAKMSYSAAISEAFSESAGKILALEEENARLKASLNEALENLAGRGKGPGVRAAPAGGKGADIVSQAQVLAPTATVYCVQAGDTLSLIAGKLYNDPRKWKLILDANSASLPSPERLRSGQVLNIPR